MLAADSAPFTKAFFRQAALIVWLTSSVAQATNLAPTYVGSDQCIDCHQAEYSQWQLSDHHRAMQRPDEKTVLGDFNDTTVVFHGIETRFFRQGRDFMVATAGRDGKPGVFKIDYTFGHYPLQQYLVDVGKGHLQALNLAWDSRSKEQGGRRWYHLQADEYIDPEHPFYWTRHLANANSRCIECHATDMRKNFDPENSGYATSWSETGVGCESCHGPASNHVDLAAANKLIADNTGFNRKRMPRLNWAFRGENNIALPSSNRDDSYIDTCGGCHSRRSSIGDVTAQADYHDQYRLALLDPGLYFGDGQIDDEVFVLGSFLQSKMALQGVTCNNCHSPHSGKLIAQGNGLCTQCHKPGRFDTDEHHHHLADSAGAQCVNCHMPERVYMTIDPRRDHSFPIPDPDFSIDTGTPNACTSCHQDKSNEWAQTTLRSWGVTQRQNVWARLNRGLTLQDSMVFKEYAERSSVLNPPPIRQATLIEKLAGFPSRLAMETSSRYLSDPNPLIRRAAVSALQSMPPQVRWQLLKPLIEDPVKSVRLEVARSLSDVLSQLSDPDAKRLGKLIDEYREWLDYNADTPAGQLAIGILESGMGFSILAEQAYLKAIAIESNYVPALINLADMYREIGSDGEAGALLQRALEIAPDSANANHAYGLYLVRSGKQGEALDYLATATRQEDTNPRHVYVYAVALDSTGQTDAAIQIIDEASGRWPNNIDLYYLQVSYMDKTGNTQDIHRYLSPLATVAADNPQVRRWMGKYK
jgi:predicted CXXCH cytochrome family protein